MIFDGRIYHLFKEGKFQRFAPTKGKNYCFYELLEIST